MTDADHDQGPADAEIFRRALCAAHPQWLCLERRIPDWESSPAFEIIAQSLSVTNIYAQQKNKFK